MPRRTNRTERTTKGPSVVTSQSGGKTGTFTPPATGALKADFSLTTSESWFFF